LPEQFDYPEEGMWGVTQLKKKSGRVPSALSEQEWAGMKDKAGMGKFYDSKDDLSKAISESPQGFLTKKDHPGLGKVDDQVDTFTVPSTGGADMSDWLFVKPKAVTS
jgi:hypothetical protein